MKTKNAFVALGGGQEVGASSYFMSLGGKHFLFDCGRGVTNNIVFGPDFTALLDPFLLSSLSQINSVFVSHGHFDHVGYIPDLLSQCMDVPIFATALTKELGVYLMGESMGHVRTGKNKLSYETQCIRAFNHMNTLNYNERLELDGYSVTLFEAGHIPGAAMVYVETEAGSVLYTGDFSLTPTALTGGCAVPSHVCPDTVVLCGVHAKHPLYDVSTNKIASRIASIGFQLRRFQPVYLQVKQLTKGLEILQVISDFMGSGTIPKARIYIDGKLWELSKRFSNAGMPVLNENCYKFPQILCEPEFGLYVGFEDRSGSFDCHQQVDFSAHADYEDIKQFLGRFSPKNVILVHSPDGIFESDKYALRKELLDFNFIYAENGKIYEL